MIQAKFRCISVRKYENTTWADGKATKGFAYEYEFQVVTGGSPENEQFFSSTPYGQIKLTAVREDLFQPGDHWYTNFVKVE